MAHTRPLPPVSAKTKNVMRNPAFAQQVVDKVNAIHSAEVRIGGGPSGLSSSPDKVVVNVSIDEIINQLRDRGII